MRGLPALALLALAACQQQTVQSAVSLPGPNSLVVGGRHLFVASTSSDELRALDLKPDTHVFVRAPNPLFPLAIPTAPLPRAVAGFTDTDGKGPPYVFALSTAAGLVNVVSATQARDAEDAGRLATLVSMAVPDTSLAIAVTRPDGADARLVIAVVQGGSGALWTADFAPGLTRADLAAVKPSPKVALGVSTPQALAASPTDANLVAVADRQAGAGGLALCDLATGAVVRVDVGGPVMAVSFDPSGTRLFGLLDAEACGSESPCNGMFGVDLTDKASPRLVGVADVPGTARGLAAGGAVPVTLPNASTPTIDPLVIVSSTDGALYAYDGAAVTPVDTSANEAGEAGQPWVVALKRLEPDGATTDNPTTGPQVKDASGNTTIQLTRGVVRTETLTLTWEGALVKGRAGVASAGALEDPAFDFAARGVRAGDLLVFDGQTACATGSVPVGAVAAGRVTFEGFDVGCLPQGPVAYTIRAPGAFAVQGSRSGFLGRIAPNASFTGGGATFEMGSGEPLVRDARYELSLGAGIQPFSVPLVTVVTMPGAVAYDPVKKFFFAAYPGGNAVIQLDPTQMRSGSADVGVVAFR